MQIEHIVLYLTPQDSALLSTFLRYFSLSDQNVVRSRC